MESLTIVAKKGKNEIEIQMKIKQKWNKQWNE